jgi:hypothetical protein
MPSRSAPVGVPAITVRASESFASARSRSGSTWAFCEPV